MISLHGQALERRTPVRRCRVCLKRISEGEDHLTVHYRGGDYPLCCPSCAAKFQAAPLEYVGDPRTDRLAR